MDSAMHRHDISDHVWSLLAPLLPGRRGAWGGRAKDNRLFVNAIFWILRTGAPWRNLPPEYGGWKNTHRRFCRWRDKGTWEHVLAAGAKDGNQDMSRTKGGSTLKYIWPWMRMVCRSESLLQRVPVLISVRLSHSFKV